MKVRCIKECFVGGSRRRPGDVFEVPDRLRSQCLVPADQVFQAQEPQKAKGPPRTFSEITKTDGMASLPKGV